jgi:DHA1 family bicyclomycin/chloramphenicol resistance-like MFS transporter
MAYTSAMPQLMSQTTVVFILALLMGIQPVTTDLYLPALPAITEGFGATLAQAQYTLSALLLSFGVSQLIWGPLSDRFGRKPILLAGLSMYTVAAVGAAWADSIQLLITWRIWQGLSMGAVVMCGRALVRDLYTPVEGAQVMSKGLTGLGVLACMSPPLGGFLSGHISTKAALLAMAVFGLLSFLYIAVYFKESVRHKNQRALEPKSLARNWWMILKNPAFLTYSALSSASFCVLFVFLASSSFVFIKLFGFSSAKYGLIMFGMSSHYIAGTFLCRWLLARYGMRRTVAVAGGISLLGGTLLGVLAWSGAHSFWAILLPFYVIAVGHGIHQPCGQTGAIAPFGKAAGTASAVNGFLMMVLAFATGHLLNQHADGSVMPMAMGMWFWTVCIAVIAWWAVQKLGQIEHA